jgi:hypothetical protein
MQINLLLTEPKRSPAIIEGHHLHPKNARIKIAGLFDVSHCQRNVINAIDADHLVVLLAAIPYDSVSRENPRHKGRIVLPNLTNALSQKCVYESGHASLLPSPSYTKDQLPPRGAISNLKV